MRFSMFATYTHFDNYSDAVMQLASTLGDLHGLNVLEAGCGSGSYLDLSRCVVTGVDISQHQLDRNQQLAHRVCADLHVYENPTWNDSFDLIICWDVVEHLRDPKVAIEKFLQWLKPNGRLVLAYPNPQILKGYATKYTPYFVHQAFYKLASGTPFSASKTDQGPFRTFFNRDLHIVRLKTLFERYGCVIEHFLSAESYQNKFIKKYLSAPVVNSVNRIFLGELKNSLHHSATDFILVISKRA
jgi:SAM-dependent methyltransferase